MVPKRNKRLVGFNAQPLSLFNVHYYQIFLTCTMLPNNLANKHNSGISQTYANSKIIYEDNLLEMCRRD